MRRLSTVALVCALICLLPGAGPALAATGHHHHAHQAAAATHHTSTTTHSSSAASPITSSGKATTKDGETVLNDCQDHGQLTHDYPLSWLKKAQSMMSAGTAQYSNCSTVLQQAILHHVHPGSGGGGGGSGTTVIVIIVVVVLVVLAALLGVLALRRRRGGGPTAAR